MKIVTMDNKLVLDATKLGRSKEDLEQSVKERNERAESLGIKARYKLVD